MDSDHFQKGFRFAGKIFLACFVVGVVGYFSWWYASELHSKSVPAAFLTAVQEALNLSTTTPQRIINTLTIAGVVPQTGKFIAADLSNMKLTLYQDGAAVAEYPILTKGRTGSPYETPSGFYSVLTKERDHFNTGQKVHLPWSLQFYGNYFIHGWPYYDDGSPVNPSYSGGCIRLSVADAEKIYAFAEKGTGIFVYDPILTAPMSSLVLGTVQPPSVSAGAYLVADIDTGDVFLEQDAENPRPIASVTKLMTALVANETIMFNNKVTVTNGELTHASSTTPIREESFVVGDLFYPLLMESNNAVADRLAQYYGEKGFVGLMNTTAKALDMQSTHFADASGISAENTSTPDDLFRLATYIANKKSFILDITRTPTKNLVADSGDTYHFSNFNIFSDETNFIGGKVGQTTAAQNTMASIFSIPVNGVQRRVAIIVLKSDNYTTDTTKLTEWFTQSAQQGLSLAGASCVSCAVSPHYRKIQQ